MFGAQLACALPCFAAARASPKEELVTRVRHRVLSILVSALTLTALVGLHQPVAHAAVWPYTALQSELNTTYATIQRALAPLPVITSTNHYAVPLFWADGTMGSALVGSKGSLVNFNVQRCTTWLQAMKAAGFKSTIITVAWPMLDPNSTDPNLSYYQSFYTQVVQQAKALGFWVAMTSGISPTGSVDYSVYSSIDQVFRGRRSQAWWIAKNLQPDWIVAGAEPSTDKTILGGIKDISRFDSTYWGNYFAALMAGKPSGTPTKYAGGASPHDPQAYFDAVMATSVDGTDQHPFPLTNAGLKTGNQFWNQMLNRFDQARAAHKAILVTQTSPYKESAAETAAARLTFNDIYLRDVWDGFQPQDQAWEAMWQQIVLKKGLTATVYWWANRTFLGGYIPYNPLLTYTTATQQVDNASWAHVQIPGYLINTEGQRWASFVH